MKMLLDRGLKCQCHQLNLDYYQKILLYLSSERETLWKIKIFEYLLQQI